MTSLASSDLTEHCLQLKFQGQSEVAFLSEALHYSMSPCEVKHRLKYCIKNYQQARLFDPRQLYFA